MMTKNDKAPVIKQSQTALSFVAIKGVSPNAMVMMPKAALD
jgi:hypothetical protein